MNALFKLPKGKRGGNTDPYDKALGKGESNSKYVVRVVKELSLRRHKGRLQCKMSAGLGVGHRESLAKKASENNLVNRLRGGDRGMGTSVYCSDKKTKRGMILYPRIASRNMVHSIVHWLW